MDFEAIENELVAYLTTKLNDPHIEVQAIPEDDTKFELPFGKRKVIVAFGAEEPDSASKSTDAVYQEGFQTFSFLIQSKFLRGEKGVYTLVNRLKALLIGYRPAGGEPFKYGGFRFESKEKNVFQYSLDLKTKSPIVQVEYPDENFGIDPITDFQVDDEKIYL